MWEPGGIRERRRPDRIESSVNALLAATWSIEARMKVRSYLLVFAVAVLLPMIAIAAVVVVAFDRQQRAAVELGAMETARALMNAVDRELTGSIARPGGAGLGSQPRPRRPRDAAGRWKRGSTGTSSSRRIPTAFSR